MPYLIKNSSRFRSRRIKFLRSLRIYSWRVFCILFIFVLCNVALYMGSPYFRGKVLEKIDVYSRKFGYVIKLVEIQEGNSSNYCINFDEKKILTKYQNLSIILFSAHKLKKELEKIDCIDKIAVRKIFPFKIRLNISYKIPIAIWQSKKIFYFITATGEVMKIRNNKGLDKFILIRGANTSENATSLLRFISSNKEIYTKISMAVWVGQRRWNIIFDDGTKLMLPEESPENAWTKFIRLQQTHPNFRGLKYKVIDFRITNKIYVQQ